MSPVVIAAVLGYVGGRFGEAIVKWCWAWAKARGWV